MSRLPLKTKNNFLKQYNKEHTISKKNMNNDIVIDTKKKKKVKFFLLFMYFNFYICGE